MDGDAGHVAWEKAGNANEMDVDLWFEDFENPQAAKAQIGEYAKCAV